MPPVESVTLEVSTDLGRKRHGTYESEYRRRRSGREAGGGHRGQRWAGVRAGVAACFWGGGAGVAACGGGGRGGHAGSGPGEGGGRRRTDSRGGSRGRGHGAGPGSGVAG